MTHYFFDSSALVKRYIAEQGTNWVRSIIHPSAGHVVVVAYITRVEIISGVSRRKRDQQITPRTASAIRLLLNRHISRDYLVIRVTDDILHRAEDLLENHPLRAYDSIQLASALVSNDRLLTSGLAPLIFLSADTRLLTVASAVGLTTDDPNAHP